MQRVRALPIDVAYTWIRYYREHGRAPRLFHPVRYTEKVQWRRLFDRDPMHPVVSDKLAMRAFVSQKVGAEMLIPLLWMGDDPDTIPFESFSEPYVLKCTHGNRMNVFIDDPAGFDEAVVRAELGLWLARNRGKDADGRALIRPRIIAEPMLRGRAEALWPVEYRFVMFEGRTALIGVRTWSRHHADTIVQMRPDWTLEPLSLNGRAATETVPARPEELDQMGSIAETLSAGFDHIRIDFLVAGGRAYVSELTPCPDTRTTSLQPDAFDLWMGELWKLQDPAERALSALLGRRPGPL